jgi:hypothetical protein
MRRQILHRVDDGVADRPGGVPAGTSRHELA